MIKETKIAPPNSLLLVMDKDNGEIPEFMDGKLVVATRTCIAVGTLSQADGETLVTLTDQRPQDQEFSGLQKIHSGTIVTPKKFVDVCTVSLQPVLTMPVHDAQCDVEIWANNETEPDRLCILIKNRAHSSN